MRSTIYLFVSLYVATTAFGQTAGNTSAPKQPKVATEQWGHLSGQVVFDGEPPQPKQLDPGNRYGIGHVLDESLVVHPTNKGIANVLVWIRRNRQSPIKIHPSYEESAEDQVTLEMQRGYFRPHVLLLRTSQTMVHNSLDEFAYNPKMGLLKNPQM